MNSITRARTHTHTYKHTHTHTHTQVREDNNWLDIVLEQLDIGGRFADAKGPGPGLFGPQRNLRSIAVSPGKVS
jgi:hypothetical protein